MQQPWRPWRMGPQGILGLREDLHAIAPPLIAWLQQQVRHELIGDPDGFGAARRTPSTEPGESKPGESGVSRQPAKTAPVAESTNKYRQHQAKRPRQLIIIVPGNYFIIAPRNPRKKTPFNDGKDIATFGALNLTIANIISFCHIANKLLDEDGGK